MICGKMVALGRQAIPNDSDSLDKICVILFEAVYKCAHPGYELTKHIRYIKVIRVMQCYLYQREGVDAGLNPAQ